MANNLHRFIERRLRLAPVPLLPEIMLYTAHAGSGLSRIRVRGGAHDPTPYWAWPWAGGIVLARYVLDHPERIAGRRVLDLGSGSGLVAIAAAMAGAVAVRAAEIDPYARAAIELNAAVNGVEGISTVPDPTLEPPFDADLILAGDVFYDAEVAIRMAGFLDRCALSGIEVLVGDPGRAHLPLERLHALADYSVGDFGAKGSGHATVFAFLPANAPDNFNPAHPAPA